MAVLAEEFAILVETDDRFELFVPVRLGLVCFRLKVGYHLKCCPLLLYIAEPINFSQATNIQKDC